MFDVKSFSLKQIGCVIFIYFMKQIYFFHFKFISLDTIVSPFTYLCECDRHAFDKMVRNNA